MEHIRIARREPGYVRERQGARGRRSWSGSRCRAVRLAESCQCRGDTPVRPKGPEVRRASARWLWGLGSPSGPGGGETWTGPGRNKRVFDRGVWGGLPLPALLQRRQRNAFDGPRSKRSGAPPLFTPSWCRWRPGRAGGGLPGGRGAYSHYSCYVNYTSMQGQLLYISAVSRSLSEACLRHHRLAPQYVNESSERF
jgi:hypothetical protein